MALTPEEQTALVNAVAEIANAINDRVNATTAQQRQAALTRFNTGMRAYTIAILNMTKHGTTGDYT